MANKTEKKWIVRLILWLIILLLALAVMNQGCTLVGRLRRAADHVLDGRY